MIKLQRVRFQASKPMFTPAVRKGLRISIQHIAKNSKIPARVINETCLQWEENFYLPLLYGKQLAFEIFNVHSFGYNPEELFVVYWGSVIISGEKENYGAWEVFDNKHQRVGFLSANILSIKNVHGQQTQNKLPTIFDTEPKSISINSLVVHLPIAQGKVVYVSVQLGDTVVQTMRRKSQYGQFVFLDEFHLYKESSVFEAKISIYEENQSKNEDDLLAIGKMTLIGQKPEKRILLTKNYERLGQLYVQANISKKDEAKKQFRADSYHFFQKKHKQAKNKDKFYSSVVQDTPALKEKGKSSAMPPRYDKYSLGKKNTEVLVNKSKKRSLEKEARNRSMEGKVQNSKIYRGAGMGFGWKTDFAKENEDKPGVGSYHLPSIFDKR